MSRVGKAPIEVPKGVEVKQEKDKVIVKGPKGTLSQAVNHRIKVEIKDGKLTLTRVQNDKRVRALHGLYRALLANMVHGVAHGFEKVLELSGVGYRAALAGKKLTLTVGFSHPVEIDPPEGVFLPGGRDQQSKSDRHQQDAGRAGRGRCPPDPQG